ncbi:Glycosyl transferase [Rhodococcus sp. AW25M09]|uniref:glycosyltransferase family 2 protein n=1 Tax=Rhodococcus sp. AW25M09 TaxID=1268303 RepID=UPI0002ACD4DB|nr:glycosyltransferase [Rhodococcus sp. AW25M09]CCQ13657.1 Glycosyl transferase [Rhodococcus sp. AW25M09]
MKLSVSVIIPTIGRSSLDAAVRSALAQTYAVSEVVVVVDSDIEPVVPEDDRVTVIHTGGGAGSSRARQSGIDESTGDVIGLLDDDDVWLPDKLDIQLSSLPTDSALWIASCRFRTITADGGGSQWPVRLIGIHEPVDQYLVRFYSLRFGGASAQTSTLLFPREIAEAVPMDLPLGAVHDDPSWLIDVRRRFPDIPIVQSPDVLVEYNMTSASLSRTDSDQSAAYIQWGKEYLEPSDRRSRGDYFLTSPLSSAVSGKSLRGVVRSLAAGVWYGRPGKWAWGFALVSSARLVLMKAMGIVAQLTKR